MNNVRFLAEYFIVIVTWVPGSRSHRELRHAWRGPPSRLVPQRAELREGGQDHRGAPRGEGRRHGRAFEDAGEFRIIFEVYYFSWSALLFLSSQRSCVKLASVTKGSHVSGIHATSQRNIWIHFRNCMALLQNFLSQGWMINFDKRIKHLFHTLIQYFNLLR